MLGLVHDRRAGAACRFQCCSAAASCCCSIAWPAPASSFPAALCERHSAGPIRFPAHTGGSPILWQHLFWFFGHPEVYIAILPGMGATSHILSTFARKPVFGYRAMVFAIFAIGLLGFFVWGHHMFISGMSPYSAMTFSILTLSIGVPSAVKTFNWLGTLVGRENSLHHADAVCHWLCLAVCGRRHHRLVLGQTSLDLPMHDTYFVTAHFHLVMGVASIFGMFAATYFWFPKMFGRMMNETSGQVSFLDYVRRRLLHLRSHAHHGNRGHAATLFAVHRIQFPCQLHPLVVFVSIAAIITVLVAVSVLLQSDLEHLQRQEGTVTIPGKPPRSSGPRRARRRTTTLPECCRRFIADRMSLLCPARPMIL